MKTTIKVAAVVLGVAVLAIVAAAILVPMYVDPNDYKDTIAAMVREKTGRELRIAGTIALSVFPWLGVDLGAVELGNAPGFAEKTFARTERVQVRVKLLPLLTRTVEMDTVTIHGLVVNLARDRTGRANWHDLTASAPPGAPSTDKRAPELAALAIGGLDIQDARITWDDQQAGRKYTVDKLSVTTGRLAPGAPVDVTVRFAAAGGAPAVSGQVGLEGRVRADVAAQRYAIEGLRLQVTARGAQFAGGALDASLEGTVGADLERQTLEAAELKLAVADLKASGTLSITDLRTSPRFSGTFAVTRFSPRALLRALGQPPPRTADPKALAAAELSTALSGRLDRVSLNPLRVKLDETTLTGTVEATSGAGPAIRFDLGVDAIDADRYLPPHPAEGKATPTPGTAAAGGGQIAIEPLRALEADGTLRVGALRVAKLRLTDVQVTVKAKGGLIQVHPLLAKLYGGTYTGRITMDAGGRELAVAVDERLSGIQAGPLLEDLQGQDRLTGRGDVTLKATAKGASPEALRQTLNGSAAFRFADGAWKGVNIGKLLREARARLKGRSLTPEEEVEKTDFSELAGTVQFTNGIATNTDLVAKSPLLRVEGRGTADLVREQLDYRLTATVVATSKGQGGKELDDLAGVPIPIKVSGPFAEPRYALDLQALLRGRARTAVEEQLRKLGERLSIPDVGKSPGEGESTGRTRGLPIPGGDKLRGLFGR
jgi:AsmA protein